MSPTKTAVKLLTITTLLLIAAPPPTAPAAQATLTWTINAPTATQSVVQRRLSTDPQGLYQDIATIDAPTNTYTDQALEADKIYCWVIYSKNATTVSQKSAENCLLAPPGWTAILYLK